MICLLTHLMVHLLKFWESLALRKLHFSIPFLQVGDFKKGIYVTKFNYAFHNFLASPTTRFLNLKFNKADNTLSWEKPNCSLMTGPIKAATLILEGISENVKKSVSSIHLTGNVFSYDLSSSVHGAETYGVRLYPKRNSSTRYNPSVFTNITFTTLPTGWVHVLHFCQPWVSMVYPPFLIYLPSSCLLWFINLNVLAHTVPPAVSDFDVWEIDTKKNISKIKWKPLAKPSGGELEYYMVQVNYTNNKVKLSKFFYFSNESCLLWPGFICISLTLPNLDYQISVSQ